MEDLRWLYDNLRLVHAELQDLKDAVRGLRGCRRCARKPRMPFHAV